MAKEKALPDAVGRQKQMFRKAAWAELPNGSAEEVALKAAELAKAAGKLFEPTADEISEKEAADKGASAPPKPGPKPGWGRSKEASLADSMEALQKLCERYGANEVKRLADIFGG